MWTRIRPVVFTLLVATLGLFVVACSSSSSANTGGKVGAVASFYPLVEAAQRVGGDRVAATNLTPPGVEPHDLELTPSQIESISTAELVLYLGGGFQPAVEDALSDATGKTVDVSSGLRTLPVPPGESEPSLTADPHVWLDPVLFSQLVGKVRDALAEVDPAHADAFARNARAYEEELSTLNHDYRAGLSTCDRSVIVTSHAAFGYLSRRYGLVQEPIAGLSPDAEPDPQHLADLKALVEREGITTIFTEDLVSPKVAQTLASETGATTAVLNPLESLTPAELDAGEDYVSVMRQNLSLLRNALGCS